MPAHKRVTDKQLTDAYTALGSVQKVGVLLGINASSVHERLVKMGANVARKSFTKNDQEMLRRYYTETPAADFDLAFVAEVMGRTKPYLSRQAALLGLANANRPVSTAKHHKMVRNMRTNGTDRYHQGPRPEVGPGYFRSKWEVNYARYLNFLIGLGEIQSWQYEPDTFWFEKIRRGVRSYTPDFKIFEADSFYYVEIKGWMDAKSLTKLKRMRIYYPKTDIRLVDSKSYLALAKHMKTVVPGWEP